MTSLRILQSALFFSLVISCQSTKEAQEQSRPVSAPLAAPARGGQVMASAEQLDAAFREYQSRIARDLSQGRALLMRSGRSVKDPNYDPNEIPPPDVLPISVELYPPPGIANAKVDGARLTLVSLPHVFLPATIIEAGDASIGKEPAMPRKTELALMYLDANLDWQTYATGKLSPTDLANLRTAVGKLTIESVLVDITVTLENLGTPRPRKLYAEWRCIVKSLGGGPNSFSACLVPAN